VRTVPATVTRTEPAAIRAAIGRAWERLTGQVASPGVLDALSAQAMLETGRGTKMVAYNFGGIKGVGPSGLTTRARTKEVENGKTVDIVDGFRAYRSLEEGALDYVRLLRSRFGAAVARAEAGDLDGFAHELKRAHYYTADEHEYAAALRAMSVAAPPPEPQRPPSRLDDRTAFQRTTDLVRVLDALRASAMRIADDEDRD
jgi:hypothetical protein